MAYNNPLTQTYRFPASATLSAAAIAGRIIGPAGLSGRVLAASVIVTTQTTGADATITVGPNGDTAKNLSMVVPASAVNAGHVATGAELAAGADLDEDTVLEVAGDGGATAGAADIVITVGWF